MGTVTYDDNYDNPTFLRVQMCKYLAAYVKMQLKAPSWDVQMESSTSARPALPKASSPTSP